MLNYKYISRLLAAVFLLFITVLYFIRNNPDIDCYGLVDLFANIFYIICFLIGFIFTAITAFKKYEKFTFFKYFNLIAILIAAFILIFNKNIRGHLGGKQWLFAISQGNIGTFNTSITLRKNFNCTIESSHADFGCAISGKYFLVNDTLIFDSIMISKVGEGLAIQYQIKENTIVPLSDTMHNLAFNIVKLSE